MSVLDNGGFIGRTADYGSTETYSDIISITHLQSQDLFEPDATSFSSTFDVSGTNASDVLVICGGGEATTTTTNMTVSSIVINGVATSAIVQTNYNLNQGLAVGIFAIVASNANIDSNTTNVTVTINFNTTFRRTGLSVYRLSGTGGIIPSFTTDISGVNASAATVSTSASEGNATIAVVYNNDDDVLTPASTDLSIDYQSTEVELNNGSYGVASKTSSATETITTTGAVDGSATVAAQVTFQGVGTTVFTDTFETFTGWTTQGSGVLSQSSTQAYAGTYSAYKTTNGDPSGAYKLLDTPVNREYIVETWIFSEEPRAGGTADRISIVDASGNGYGFIMLGSTFRAERRDAYAATAIGTDTSWTRPANAWYRIVFEAKNDNTFTIAVYNSSGTLLGSHTSNSDTTYAGSFDRVAILGGANYYVDNLTVTNLETVNKNKKNSGLWSLDASYKNFLPDIYTNSLVLWMDAANEKSYGVSENFVPYSTDITPSAYPDWEAFGGVTSVATTGVDGQNDAFTLTDSNTGAYAVAYVAEDNNDAVYETVQTMTVVCHVKKNTGGTWALIQIYFQDTPSYTNGTFYGLYINPDNGDFVESNATNTQVVSEGDWWRVMFEVQTDGAPYDRVVCALYPAIGPAGASLAGNVTTTGSNTFWNPQLQRGPKSNYSRPVKTGSTPIKREERWWDVSGQNNDGVVTGGAVYNSTYFEFDGLDDYIELGTITTSNPLQLSSPADGGLTIMFATYWDGTGDSYQRIIDKSNGGSGSNGWCIYPSSASPPAGNLIFQANPGTAYGLDSGQTLAVSTWEIWAVTHDQTSGAWVWYRNGESIVTGNATYNVPNVQTNARIGTWNHSTAREWNGRIGFMLVYEKALTQREITQNYNALKGSYGL